MNLDEEKESSEESEYEAVLEEVGFGKFQILLLLVCSWANASDAVEVLCVSFVLPSAECDLHLTSRDKGILTAMIFLGMMVGGYVWGFLGDSIGRKTTLVSSLFVNSIGGLLSALVGTWWLFAISRFVSGLGVGGSIPVVWAYFAEFQVARNRGTMISLLAVSWIVGQIITAGFAWVVIPMSLSFASWRVFIVICVIPAFTAGIALIFFPESPKFYLKSGQAKKAKLVLLSIYQTNNGQESPPPAFECSTIFDDFNKTSNESWSLIFAQLFPKTKNLFRPPHSTNNALMLLIFFTVSFGTYGMQLWLPSLFAMAEKTGVSPCSYSMHPTSNSSLLPNDSPNCTSDIDPATFKDSLIQTVATLPGNLVSIFLVDRIGRKPLMVASLLLGGASVFFMPLVISNTHLVILSCFFGAFTVIAWNTLDCLSTELFPTSLRSTALGLQLALGRIAAIIGTWLFGELIVVNCAVPISLVAISLTIGGLASLKLPQTTGIVLS